MQTFRIKNEDDEVDEYYIGDQKIAEMNHDDHGWDGMSGARRLFENVAVAIGAKFERYSR